MMTTSEHHRGLMREFIRRVLASLLLVGAILFGAAGRIDWPEAWIYLALAAATTFAGGFWLARRDPDLLRERLGSLIQPEQKGWDKALMVVMLAASIGWLALIGLDAGRYRWSNMPHGLKVPGLALIGMGTYLVWLSLKANSYAAPVVKIQKARGHLVASTGPYAYIRQPMYAGAILFIAGIPLWLGSWWGLAAGIFLVLIIAVRAVFEERALAAELKGYADYAVRIRYCLVPYLW